MAKSVNVDELIRSTIRNVQNLRTHQAEFVKEVENAPFGLIRQTCGAGKTLEQAYAIAREIERAESENRKAIVLVMSHRLLLNNQLVREYCKFIKNDNVTFANLSTGKIDGLNLDEEVIGDKRLMDVDADGMKCLMRGALKNQKNSTHIVAMITSVRATMKVGNKVDIKDKSDVFFTVLNNHNRNLDLIIIDEAHKVIDFDSLSYLREHTNRGFIFTATPRENNQLLTMFPELDCVLNFKTAVQNGYVVKPTLKCQLSSMDDEKLEKPDELAKLLIKAYEDLEMDFGAQNAHLLAFLDSVDSVYKVYKKLNSKAYNVYAFSSAKTDKEGNEIGGCYHNGTETNKEELLEELANDETPKIILNAQMITEGIDLPNISGVAIYSKKGDASLYQAIMRGCRLFEDKETFNTYIPQGFVSFSETDKIRIKGLLFDLIYGLDGELDFGTMFEDIDLGSSDDKKEDKKNLIQKLQQIKQLIDEQIKITIETVDYENDFYHLKSKYLNMSIDERNELRMEILFNPGHQFYERRFEIVNW